MHEITKRKMRRAASVIIPLVITTIFWIMAKFYRNDFADISVPKLLQFTSQILSLYAVVLFSISMFVATRLRIVEIFFGGLDKVYKLHNKVSRYGFVMIILHPLLLMMYKIDDPSYITSLIIPFYDTPAKTFGILSLLMFVVLVLITIFRFLPYHIWKATHSFLGLAFIFGGIHALWADSDIAAYAPLRAWMIAWIAIGTASFIYKTFLYKNWSLKYEYEITELKSDGNINEIFLKPSERRISFEPGEFVFASFKNHEWIKSELHPFSISSGNMKDTLRISYKVLGDYTKTLEHAKVGDKLDLYGPYGEFSSYVFNKYKKQIWIGGGIGITPFLSMFAYESQNEDKKNISLFYCTKKNEEAYYNQELQQIAKESDDNVKYFCYTSQEYGRITANKIKEMIQDDPNEHLILMCGPEKMMHSLRDQFVNHGIDKDMIVFEEFNFV